MSSWVKEGSKRWCWIRSQGIWVLGYRYQAIKNFGLKGSWALVLDLDLVAELGLEEGGLIGFE